MKCALVSPFSPQGKAAPKSGWLIHSNLNLVELNKPDYEKGMWTPRILFGGNDVGVAYSLRAGRYEKIGNVVFFELMIELANKGTSVGGVTVTGLPYPSSAELPNRGFSVGYFSDLNLPSDAIMLSFFLTINSNSFIVRSLPKSGGATTLTNVHILDNSIFRFSGSYHID